MINATARIHWLELRTLTRTSQRGQSPSRGSLDASPSSVLPPSKPTGANEALGLAKGRTYFSASSSRKPVCVSSSSCCIPRAYVVCSSTSSSSRKALSLEVSSSKTKRHSLNPVRTILLLVVLALSLISIFLRFKIQKRVSQSWFLRKLEWSRGSGLGNIP